MKDLKKWMSHYISIAPPFIGAKKADLLIAKGTDEFSQLIGIIDVPRFSQNLYAPFIAGGHALRPVNPLKEMLNDEDENVKKVGKVLVDVMKSEVCTMLKHKCTKTSSHLKTLFNNEFKWMDDAEAAAATQGAK